MQLNALVFPAPFGPMTAMISFSWAEKVSPSTAFTPPKTICRSLTSSTTLIGRPPWQSSDRRHRSSARSGSCAAGGPEPLWSEDHDHDEQQAEDEVPVGGEIAQQLGQEADHERAEHYTAHVAHATEHHCHQYQRRLKEDEALRRHRGKVRSEQNAADTAPDRAEDVGHQLHLVGVDAHCLCGVLVLPHEAPGAPEPGLAEPRGGQHEARNDEHRDVVEGRRALQVEVADGQQPRDPEDAGRPAGDGEVVGGYPGDLTEPERDDGQVVAAQPKSRRTDDQSGQNRHDEHGGNA